MSKLSKIECKIVRELSFVSLVESLVGSPRSIETKQSYGHDFWTILCNVKDDFRTGRY